MRGSVSLQADSVQCVQQQFKVGGPQHEVASPLLTELARRTLPFPRRRPTAGFRRSAPSQRTTARLLAENANCRAPARPSGRDVVPPCAFTRRAGARQAPRFFTRRKTNVPPPVRPRLRAGFRRSCLAENAAERGQLWRRIESRAEASGSRSSRDKGNFDCDARFDTRGFVRVCHAGKRNAPFGE